MIEHPPQQPALLQQHQDRPRKKLSFRDPEVTSMAGKDGTADHSTQPHLALLKDQGFSDSMENVDLEVVHLHSWLVSVISLVSVVDTFEEKERAIVCHC